MKPIIYIYQKKKSGYAQLYCAYPFFICRYKAVWKSFIIVVYKDEQNGMNVFVCLQCWHCSNCEKIAAGYPNRNDVTKVECNRCHVTMLIKSKGSHHDIIEIFESVSVY